jgi:hypothetical protein
MKTLITVSMKSHSQLITEGTASVLTPLKIGQLATLTNTKCKLEISNKLVHLKREYLLVTTIFKLFTLMVKTNFREPTVPLDPDYLTQGET